MGGKLGGIMYKINTYFLLQLDFICLIDCGAWCHVFSLLGLPLFKQCTR
jgi:hypothetical protein